MACSIEISALPLLTGCPADDEWILVGNAVGGEFADRYARRLLGDIRECWRNTFICEIFGEGTIFITGDDLDGTNTYLNSNLTSNLTVFFNSGGRYLIENTEWIYVRNVDNEVIGIQILFGTFSSADYFVITPNPICSGTVTGGSFTQIQADWTETNPTAVDYIKNKPNIQDNWTTLLSSAYGSSGTIGASTTTYNQVSGKSSGYAPEITTEFVISSDCIISDLFVVTEGSQPVTGDLIVTLRINGSSTSLSLTIPAGSSAGVFSNVTDMVSITAGDVICYQFINEATSSAPIITSVGSTLSKTT